MLVNIVLVIERSEGSIGCVDESCPSFWQAVKVGKVVLVNVVLVIERI